jgi:hypothetical protein
MPKQTVPDIDFDKFVIAQIPKLFADNKILINTEYQRGDIWKQKQQIELIRSILYRYSIGVLVLFKNEGGQFEILDGQQRLLTIQKYLTDSPQLDLTNTEIPKYGELDFREKILLDAYCVFYLKLKSHDPESKEEDIVQTFLRLQEGTPLNKAEKISAYRGEFKNLFRRVRETHPVFQYMGNDKRFRLRQLAAELLLLELEGDFQNKVFPSLDLGSMISAVKKYEKSVSKKQATFFVGNLDFLNSSLNYLITGFQPRELISFYLLVSYLRRNKAGNQNLINELAEFAKQFMENLNKFSIYDTEPPSGMTQELFNRYRTYKVEAKIMTTGESIKKRFEITLAEFERLNPFIQKDQERLHDIEQKRELFFRQKGLCAECNKPMDFKKASSHHVIAHSEGGKTSDLKHAALLHEKCHERVEKRKRKADGQTEFAITGR